jgi:Zn-dependent membrane protease YugP
MQFSNRLNHTEQISWLALGGLLMPIGILSEVYFGLPPLLVLMGAISMTTSVIWLGIEFFSLKSMEAK